MNCGSKDHFSRNCPRKARQFSVMERGQTDPSNQQELAHARLSWRACYDDWCKVHIASKEDAGWYPSAPRTKPNPSRKEEATGKETRDLSTAKRNSD